MPTYEWTGSGTFHDMENGTKVDPGETVDLREAVAEGWPELEKVESDDSEPDNPKGSDGEITCAEGDCSRTVDEEGSYCWQHSEE